MTARELENENYYHEQVVCMGRLQNWSVKSLEKFISLMQEEIADRDSNGRPRRSKYYIDLSEEKNPYGEVEIDLNNLTKKG